MKTIKKIVLALAASALITDAQVTVKSYARINSSLLEADIASSAEHTLEIPESNAPNVSLVAFASRLQFPAGTTSAKFTQLNFGIQHVTNGVFGTTVENISMYKSQWNGESTQSAPHIFARDNNSNIIPLSGIIGGANIPNAKEVLLTDHRIPIPPFPKLLKQGDYWRKWFTMTVEYVDATGSHTQYLETESFVKVIPNSDNSNPNGAIQIKNTVKGGDNAIYLTIQGVRWSQYGSVWYLKQSYDLKSWGPVPDASFISVDSYANTIVRIPIEPGQPKKFWAIWGP